MVIHTNKYSAKRKYESERHFSNTTHIAIIIICALEFSCKFDTEPVNRKGRQTQNVSLLDHKLTLSFTSFLCKRFSYYIGTRQSNPLTISYR